jgi:hypothetical protein
VVGVSVGEREPLEDWVRVTEEQVEKEGSAVGLGLRRGVEEPVKEALPQVLRDGESEGLAEAQPLVE